MGSGGEGTAARLVAWEACTTFPGKVRFDLFELDTASGELRRQGSKIHLQHQPFQILVALLERPGAVVTREELRQRLWPGDTFVDFDSGLASAVKKLREALGDSAENPRFVETLPKRGYRFVVPVSDAQEPMAPPRDPASAVPDAPATVLHPSSRPQRLAIAAALVVSALAGALALDLGGSRERAVTMFRRPQIRSIAVLPLANLTGDPAQQALVEAVTDSLTTELARAGLLEVASRTSAAQLIDSRADVPHIARRLNVDGVVEGSVSRSGRQWLVNVQLIQGSSDRHVWAQRYLRDTGELAALPREVAWEILRSIPPDLQPRDGRGAAHRRPANEQAYEAYVVGRHLLGRRGAANVTRAIEQFEQAIAADPAYGPAYSGLSDAYRVSSNYARRPEDYDKAEIAARRALALDENLAEAHTSLGGVLWRYWQWDQAERELRRALDLDPGYAEGHRSLGQFLLFLRRFDEAAAELARAQELDPLSLTTRVEHANSLTALKRVDEALQELARARELDPYFQRIYQGLAFAHAKRSDWPRAIEAVQSDPAYLPGRSEYSWLGYYYAVAGRRSEAEQVLRNVEARAREDAGWSLGLAIVHLGLGDRKTALDLLERGVEERPAETSITTVLYDLLKDEPRYQALLRKMGLHLPGDSSPVTPGPVG